MRRVSFSVVLATFGKRHSSIFSPRYDWRTSGVHDIAPRDEGDFLYQGPQHVLPGAHPLPLHHPHNTITRPVISPYIPSPQRSHPYFTAPLPELPHFSTTKPIVYTYGTMKERIIAPVFNLKNEVIYTRELDPFIFGMYPEVEELSKNLTYWMVRCQNFASKWDYETREIWRKAKKNWPNTGMGMPRVGNRKNHLYTWGGRTKPSKPWNMLMPTMDVKTWSKSNRMMLTLKMLQGRLQVVDRLTLEEPTQECYLELCRNMSWDVRHTGGGVLFMDGGSRITPSSEFDRAFFFGSFFNGRNKIVRPTVLCDEQYDYNKTAAKQRMKGPKGAKNPIPINRFNAYDAMKHDRLVITEGALMQLEDELYEHKLQILPPHIRNQLPEYGYLDSEALGDCVPSLKTIQMEAAARTEEAESDMYKSFIDNPYNPWKDNMDASYAVDGADGTVQKFVDGKKVSWSMLS
ncbi:ribosomal protein L4/L1 family, putative [Trypanosoma equiperdum]|uniref:Large ribosomal subunit protein uL4m n=1 Tax=Trypanosoma equiperdum TaxID=5694 RepID=A0A1G4HYD1_TRYEQ|nr:Chain AF, uL4m [Trypanosoma brucei brucei]6HIX_AF Chain AF, Ribosomal protein L4/L1 family, putative [Trypanosoma brucei brucei]6YXX_AF Chain AF, Ribosomal protein L4/L1 family, putative [Trypanosoma brucei brucei]6YXY_AF Chain AF, uL4m [Trypanosoma brucei brucei]SCU64285.1 ribosomal protein L4/L1 family, putative [Trypanosoma equiperdum]